MDIAGFVSQAEFLLHGGLEAELAACSRQGTAAQLELSRQVKTLTLPGEMGEHFKCMGLSKGQGSCLRRSRCPTGRTPFEEVVLLTAWLMSWIQVIVLAIVQGSTEVLPISSSGHLVLVPSIFGWSDQGLVFDVAVHFGSLGPVCIYFRNDIAGLLRGAFNVAARRSETPESRMALAIAAGTVPAAVAGLLFAGWIAENLRDPAVVVVTLSGYGILLALADRYGKRRQSSPTLACAMRS